MNPPVRVARGSRALRRLLRKQTRDLRGLDLAGFRHWLNHHLAQWRADPVFTQRAGIRDLHRAQPHLQSLEEEHRRVRALDAASGQHARLQWLEQELIDTGKAIAGLTASSARAGPEKRPLLRQKLDAFQTSQQALREEEARLIQSSPQRQALLRISAELRQLRSAIGLDREEARLEELLKQQGRRSGRSGEAFEQLALTLTQEHIVPDLLRAGAGGAARLRVLRGVTLGAARLDLDQLVIRQPRIGGRPVEVLAVVEVKRNLNDLAHGFRRRQDNLAWLTGAADRYDPAVYRSRRFCSGHFDREAVHQEKGEDFLFTRDSFRHFRRDPATRLILNRLYFITRAGPLWGVSKPALARISYRIAMDERWQPDDDAYLGKLLRWCQALAEPIETPDVLRMYASTPRRSRHILVLGG